LEIAVKNMQYIYNNKKIILSLIIFAILMPIGLSVLKPESPAPTDKQESTVKSSPTEMVEVPEDDPQKKLLDYVQNRKPLSTDDEQVKFEILSTLGGSQSTILYQTPNVKVNYIRSADMFQAEILTTNIAIAKMEAGSWFENMGLSKEGICNLPLSFYLNYEIKMQLGEDAASFNPLPNGC
jgi:hypothetical protein